MGNQAATATVHRFAEVPWHVPNADGTSGVVEGEVGVDACGRKFLAQGDGGFYVQVVKMPPGFEAPVHSHDHAEVFMVLEGDCTFNGSAMHHYDMTVVDAGQQYGFVAGAEGVQFLVVRQAKAGFITAEEG